MKAIYFMFTALIVSVAAIAQGTPQQRAELKNDVARENHKKAEVVKDVFRGDRAEARADNHAAIAAHKEVKADVRDIRQTDRRNRPHHVVVRHHYRHHRHYVHHPHHKTVVVVHH